MTFLVRKFAITRIFLCPLITIYMYYYFSMVDYDSTPKNIQLQ